MMGRKTPFTLNYRKRLKSCQRMTYCCVIGDLSTKVGNYNTSREKAIGMQGGGTMNDNGEGLSDFCMENRLMIGGTLFPHKTIHRAYLNVTQWIGLKSRMEPTAHARTALTKTREGRRKKRRPITT